MVDLNHNDAIQAICDATSVTIFSYQEAIEGYFKLRGLPIPGDDAPKLAKVWPDELTDELRGVLGWPNFRCAPLAHLFQKAGHLIKRRAEDEQAFVLHWLAGLVLEHGAEWRLVADKKIREMTDLLASEKAP